MKNHSATLLLAAVCLGGAVPRAHAQVPSLITYQGRIVSNGTNFHGTGQFKFALVNANGSQIYWANSPGNPPVNAVSLAVSNGLYSVLLGDAALGNMAALTAGVFNNPDVRLRVWFNNGVNGFQQLTPDQRIAAVGYALMSASVPDGAITAGKLAANAVNSSNLVNGAITADKFAPGAAALALGTDLNVGSNGICGRVDVFSTDIGTPGVSIDGCVSEVAAFMQANGLRGADLAARSYGGYLRTWDELGVRTMEAGSASSGGGHVALYNGANNLGALLDSDNGGSGLLNLYRADGALSVELDADVGGAASLLLKNSGNFNTAVLQADSAGGGYLRLRDSANGNRATITTTPFGATQSLYNSNDLSVISLDTSADAGGRITLRNPRAADRVTLDGSDVDRGGFLDLRDSNGTPTLQLSGAELGTGGGQIEVFNSTGGKTIQLDGDDGGHGGILALYNAAGTETIRLDANASGGGRVKTQVLEITGGSDLSENFDINHATDDIQPGFLVAIDPVNPGQLIVSGRAHDRTVAGIVSGAGGVRTGMLMGQAGTKADGKHPVALTGRVYCWVDADAGGAIEPGDLLTTSATAGHGMKVTDHARAQGAVIGKAMTSLASGKGLVLVLVSLQ